MKAPSKLTRNLREKPTPQIDGTDIKLIIRRKYDKILSADFFTTGDYVYRDLTKGSISKGLVSFAVPMIAGNILQQFYNIADTLIVGRALGTEALASVGSAYTLMTFLTSVFLGLSMGAGALFSIYYGKNDTQRLKQSAALSFLLIMLVTVAINALVYAFANPILRFLQIPEELFFSMRQYLLIIFSGLIATSVYNYFACFLRAVGNSVTPLVFLGISTVMNIVLDIVFVIYLDFGIAGAAAATVFSQYVSGIGIMIYFVKSCKEFMPQKRHFKFDKAVFGEICDLSALTCAQQSAMNFGILLIQRLVDSFGAVTMAAFAAAVKIDTLAYLPVQDFGNAFSTFAAQNYGAQNSERLKKGFGIATALSAAFSVVASVVVCVFAKPLMRLFINARETEVIACGVRYLRIEGAFYVGIGCLFLLYGFYRALKRPSMSLILTVISLGLRVALAYILAPAIGETGIWLAIPIGWFVADLVGYGYWFFRKAKLLG